MFDIFGRFDNWRRKINRLNLHSGLGDSAWLLYGICRSLRPTIVVEIGSARGWSACFIGMALKENGAGRLYAVDPHVLTTWNDSNSIDTYEIMNENMKKFGLTDIVTIVRSFSHEAVSSVPKPIDVLFIDGDHSYEGVKSDWQCYAPHMREFGVVVFHDTMWGLKPDENYYRSDMGVPHFVDELRQEGYPVITFARNFGISIVQAARGGIALIPDPQEGADEGAAWRP
jgi:predicted O-methyltransferase YrrM